MLTVSRPGARVEPGVGKPVPGRRAHASRAPDDEGVGEVRRARAERDGRLHRRRGDAAHDRRRGLAPHGRPRPLDRKGRLEIVGRLKDVVISPTGENVYPDDVESASARCRGVAELAVVGVDVRGRRAPRVPRGAAKDDRPTRDDRSARVARAARHRRAAATAQRPAIVHLYEAPLPRTATRKVKREEVRAILERIDRGDARAPRRRGGRAPSRVGHRGRSRASPGEEIAAARDAPGRARVRLADARPSCSRRSRRASAPSIRSACRRASRVGRRRGARRDRRRAARPQSPRARRGRVAPPRRAPIVLPEPVQELGQGRHRQARRTSSTAR